MKTKKYTYLILLLTFYVSIEAQNPILTYDFGYAPQALLDNPSYDTQKKWHVAIPMLNHTAWGSSSGIVLHDLFADDAVPFSEKVEKAVAQMTLKDLFLVNQKAEVLNVGFQLGEDNYLSLGFYEELDAFSSFPKEIADLVVNGNVVGQSYSIEKFNIQADLLGVYHVGWHKKLEKADLGLRFKLYSGAYNVTSANNSGVVTTVSGEANIYKHILSDLEAMLNASGISENGIEGEDDASKIINRLFSGNQGIGFDLGYSRQLTNELYVSTSITDLGLMFNAKDVYNYKLEGAYETEGIHLEYDNSVHDYWEALKTEFNEKVDHKTTNDSYTVWRPLKVNVFAKYVVASSGATDCRCPSKSSNSFSHSFGGLVHLEKRNEYILPFGSVFYEADFNRNVLARISYSADRFNATNVGLALGVNTKYVHFHVGAHNLFGLFDLAKTNAVSGTFGLNVVLDDR